MSRIEEIKERLSKGAGDSEWRISIKTPSVQVVDEMDILVCETYPEYVEFIANSKSDIEYLLAEIEKRDRALAKCKEQRNSLLQNTFRKPIENEFDEEIEGLLK